MRYLLEAILETGHECFIELNYSNRMLVVIFFK